MFDYLGNTPDEIAQSLKSLHISGVRNTVRFMNPIVRFAKTQTKIGVDLDVISGQTLHIVDADGHQDEIQLPCPVLEFLDAFNHGAYPELEARVQTG